VAPEGTQPVYSFLSLDNGLIYPNLTFTDAMPETGLIPETSLQEGIPIRHVLSNSFGFGGNDSSLLFSATNFPA
ncbi:beta-ketoacyl-[acyl-carrier-protein] synthase family protein, partial [Bacteroides ovatus]